MREHGLLFSPPMILALAAGRKFRTMRAISRRNSVARTVPGLWSDYVGLDVGGLPLGAKLGLGPVVDAGIRPGDTIYAKETWSAPSAYDGIRPRDLADNTPIRYAADGFVRGVAKRFVDERGCYTAGRVRQSIFMRRWMSRFTLQVTRVFAQRPQDLTTAQILAEGIVCPMHTRGGCASFVGGCHHAATAWRDLWTDINGAESWERNEFCWVYVWKEIQRS